MMTAKLGLLALVMCADRQGPFYLRDVGREWQRSIVTCGERTYQTADDDLICSDVFHDARKRDARGLILRE